jgi:hypothetical protein
MSYFSPTQFLNNLYDNYYLAYLTEAGIDPKAPNYIYTNDWCMDTRTLKFVTDELSFQVDKYRRAKNKGKHYKLLRTIVYDSCDIFHHNDKYYIEFIKSILMVILENEAMTQEYEVNSIKHPDPLLHALLSIPQLYDNFYDNAVHFIRISNTSVKKLLDNMNENICEAIENHLKIARTAIIARTTKSSSTRSTIYKTSKIRKYRKYRKTRKAEDDGSDDEDRTSAQGRKKKSRKKKTKKRKAKKHKKYKN